MSKRILVIEDTENNRRILNDLLTNAGFEVIEAVDGEKGVAMAAEQRPDLILMDIQLPIVDGYEATRRIKANPDLRHIPIIAVTSYALSGDDAKAFAAGCDGYFAKPFSPRVILAKVREYESMKPDQRELRLRLTELHWYMLPLMSLASSNRPPNLDYIPEPSRKLVQDRLQEWDKLGASAQNALLTNQAAIQHFFETKDLTEEQIRRIEDSLTPQRKEMLCRGIEELQKLPPDERQKILDRFNQFFELTSTEKEKALTLLSEPERKQMEKTLQSLQSLPPDQRSQCIRSFDKFASMSLAERQLFLKNAERWKLMKPEERQHWRDLVEQMPLMPPIINTPPPTPRDTLPKRKSNPAVATNSY